jgi:hypothetical protein
MLGEQSIFCHVPYIVIFGLIFRPKPPAVNEWNVPWNSQLLWCWHDNAYADECRVIRERIVTPSGNVIFRSHRVCD